MEGELKEHYVYNSTGGGSHYISKGNTHRFFYPEHTEVIAGKWTAETPYLYLVTNTISSSRYKFSQVLAERVGVRTTKVQERQLQVNGVPVWFKPVSYTHPALSEVAPSAGQLEAFVRELKQHHVNTLLVSGIPASLELYHLADKYGLYIIQRLAPEERKEPGLQLRQPVAIARKLRNRPSVIAWAADKTHLNLLADSLTRLDPDRPLIALTNADAITNLPFASIDFTKLSTEQRAKLKKANQPFKMELTNDRGMSISNLYDFAAAPKVKLQWELLAGERVVDKGEMTGISLGPRQTQRLSLPLNRAEKGSARSLRVRIVLEENLPWASKGQELAWEHLNF